MHHATFQPADLTTFCRLDELGLTATRQYLEPDHAVIECRVKEPDPWCRRCGAEGVARDTVTRRLAHEPFGHRVTTLLMAASLCVVEFLVTMQESVTASLGRLKTGEHHPLDAGVEEFHRVLAEVATIR